MGSVINDYLNYVDDDNPTPTIKRVEKPIETKQSIKEDSKIGILPVSKIVKNVEISVNKKDRRMSFYSMK